MWDCSLFYYLAKSASRVARMDTGKVLALPKTTLTSVPDTQLWILESKEDVSPIFLGSYLVTRAVQHWVRVSLD